MDTPERLVVDMEKETRSLIYDGSLRRAFPTLVESFKRIDETYASDRKGYLERGNQVDEVRHDRCRPVKFSSIYDSDTSKAREAVVIFSPFSDVAPQSNAQRLTDYIKIEDDEIALFDTQRAKPHSWNQTTKSLVIHDLLKEQGHGMPVVTIFSPIPKGAYWPDEHKLFKMGEFSPAEWIVRQTLNSLQRQLHGTSSETKLRSVHLYGPSLGASNAIGAATETNRNGSREVKSVTGQELIMGPEDLYDLFERFTYRSTIGEESDTLAVGLPINEPLVRREVDAHGYEFQMFTRMIRGMARLSFIQGLTKPECTGYNIAGLLDRNVPVTVATAANSNLTSQTFDHLKQFDDDKGFQPILIEGVMGQKADHLVNEHVALSATIALAGIARAKS